MTAATNLAELAKEETEAITAEAERREVAELQAIFGSERKDTTSRSYRAALSGLEKLQKQKAKRRVLDVIDRALMDLVSVYRDAIALVRRCARAARQRGAARRRRRSSRARPRPRSCCG